ETLGLDPAPLLDQFAGAARKRVPLDARKAKPTRSPAAMSTRTVGPLDQLRRSVVRGMARRPLMNVTPTAADKSPNRRSSTVNELMITTASAIESQSGIVP